MPGKPSRKLLLLCTAAVSAIYAGAYAYTEPAATAGAVSQNLSSIGAGAPPASPSTTTPPAPPASGGPSQQTSSSSPSQGQAPASAPSSKGPGKTSTSQPPATSHTSTPRHKTGTSSKGHASSGTSGGSASTKSGGSTPASASKGATGAKSSQSSPPAAPSPAAKSPYKDGVYSGSGSNYLGSLSVAVKISGGKIASVVITSYHMHYPQSYIDPYMNREVVNMQTYKVYAVSGATASSYNFAEAVYYALQKAKA